MIFLRIMEAKLYPVILSSTNRYLLVLLFFMSTTGFAQQIGIKKSLIEGKYKFSNNIAPLDHEDNSTSWLLVYWMGRYHGFIKSY